MTWTPERVAATVLLAVFAVAVLLWLAVAGEGRRKREQWCDWCSFTGTRRDTCRCRERCTSPRCDPQPQDEAEPQQERRAA